MLINSHSDNRTVRIMESFANSFPWVKLCHAKVERSLKDALSIGWASRDKNVKYDVVQISETDAVPHRRELLKMLSLYFEEESKQVGSVTPMYTWNREFCYPTHKHWHSDPLYKKHSNLGMITNVGECGVPFLYSLWRPSLLGYINKASFKTLIHLDRDFGNHVHHLGFKHLRMKDVSIDHFGGGRKSRR